MSFLSALSELLNAGAEGVAQHQMQQQQASASVRTVKRKSASGCTPCAAAAVVDATRKSLGFNATAPAKATKVTKAARAIKK